jgi:tetratricopeptide (TPR) repeat protein
MRLAALAVIAVFGCSQDQQVYKQGDIVVVITESELTVGNEPVATVYPGCSLPVLKVEGDRLWVESGKAGWLRNNEVIPRDQGVQYFTDAIRRDPTDATLYMSKASVLLGTQDYESAIKDYDKAIELAPSWYGGCMGRGNAYRLKRDYPRAIDDYTEAIKLAPNEETVYNNRGWTFLLNGDYAKGAADLNTCLQLDPGSIYPVSNLAHLFACCPDAKFRDGQKALQNAKKACETFGFLEPESLHYLACAYAETGDFDEAVRWEQKAIELNPPAKPNNLKPYQKALGLFKQHQPFHEIVAIE